MKKNEGQMTTGILLFCLLVGLPVYLLMEKPTIFWLVFVPIAAVVIVLIVKWFKRK